MSHLKRIGIDCFNFLQEISIAIVSRGSNKELARRDAERGRTNLRWFTPDEAAVAEALARVIIPSDEETPGIDEVDVFGPPAIVALDGLVVTSPYRQYLYSRGLLAFDVLALRKHGCKFAEITREDQIGLFEAAQQINEGLAAAVSVLAKIRSKIRAITLARSGSYFAAKLYHQIRSDCFQVFYTNRVSWVWLEYDGPPMDKGYPNLLARD